MNQQSEQSFDSIESTYDFLRILSEAVAEAKREIEGEIQRESSSNSLRRLDALRMAGSTLEKLEAHINRSRRILNDLRSLRRLMFAERAALKVVAPSKAVGTVTAMPATPVPVPSLSQVAGPAVKRSSRVAA